MNQSKNTAKQMPRSFRIVSTGICLGKKRVSDTELDEIAGVEPGTIFKRTGVKNRYHVIDQNIPQMAATAIKEAVDNAGWQLSDIDALISTGSIPFQFIPSNAIHIQRELGLGNSGIPAFDINATCLSFLTACDLVSYALGQRNWKKVIIVSSEIASNGLNKNHLESFGLFGDAAVATCIDQSSYDSRLLASRVESYGDYADLCRIVGGGSRMPSAQFTEERAEQFLFDMDGVKLFKQSSVLLPKFVDRLIESVSEDLPEQFFVKELSDIDCVIPHQASEGALNLIRRRLNIDEQKWIQIVHEYGNCISASIPLALHVAHKDGRLKRGMKVLCLGTGAGLSLGGMIFRF